MLTARDRTMMAEDIDGIIYDNATPIDIWIPKETQDYNDLLGEYATPLDPDNYTILHEVPVDILDMPNEQLSVSSPAGAKISGKAIVHMPLSYIYHDEKVTVDIEEGKCMLMVPNGKHVGKWVPSAIKYRTGEIIVTAGRLAGY